MGVVRTKETNELGLGVKAVLGGIKVLEKRGKFLCPLSQSPSFIQAHDLIGLKFLPMNCTSG